MADRTKELVGPRALLHRHTWETVTTDGLMRCKSCGEMKRRESPGSRVGQSPRRKRPRR